jgi:peptidoglycan/xylan/chitin deacetylase (PgdA/CDA1 family)
MTSARGLVRGVAETAIVRSGLATLLRRRLRGRTAVLAYHNIVRGGERPSGDSSLHLPQAQFATHLDLIASVARVVPLDSLFERSDRSDECRVAITFDDAYQGALTAGLEELRHRSMPATVFVAPGLLGGDTWWDHLGAANGGVIPDDTRHYAVEDLRGDRDVVLKWFASHGGNTPRVALPRIGTELELAIAAREPGVTLGVHSWSHRNLSVLSGDELDAELASSLAWLQERYATTIPWLTYPYGLATPTVERAAERARLRGAFLVSGGWMSKNPVPAHALPRMNIPAGLSPNGLALRLSGIAADR